MVLGKKKVFNEMHSLGKTESHQQLKKKKFLPLFSQLQWKLIVKTWQDLDSYN